MNKGRVFALFLGGVLAGVLLCSAGIASAVESLTAVRSQQPVFVDGKQVSLEAYLINGNNYVKLRDIGQSVGFNVYWDGSAVQMQSDKPYTGEAPAASIQPAEGDISEEAAILVAVTDAGIRLNDKAVKEAVLFDEKGTYYITGTESELVVENGRRIYKVTIHDGLILDEGRVTEGETIGGYTTYYYNIDARTGAIIDSTYEHGDFFR